VAAVHHLEESDLRVASQVHVLGAVSDKLHKSTSRHLFFILIQYKIILGKHTFLHFFEFCRSSHKIKN
jgi:hypothetical protein